jgi:predicted ATPase
VAPKAPPDRALWYCYPVPRVFISYRRDHAAGHAGRLADALRTRFGHDRVLQDVTITPGADWMEMIRAEIAASGVVLVLIGPCWAGPVDAAGATRLHDPADIVRIEVELALARGDVLVVPVVLDETPVPRADDLPTSMRPLLARQVGRLRSDRWQADVDALLVGIEPHVVEPRPAGGAGRGRSEVAPLPPTNLPTPNESFVGREEELEWCLKLVAGGEARLLTVVGPGGSGKTRFAQELAHGVLAHFDNHAYFVDLTKIADPNLVASSISLALKMETGEPVVDALKELFRGQRALLVLDNFEQVIAAAPTVDELLRGAAGLRVVATSQGRLNIGGEHVVELPALTVDQAAALFVARAEATALSSDDPDIARLCEELDRMPLAIELIATYAPIGPPAELVKMIARYRLDMKTERLDVPERQRSLRAAMEWSHSRLTEPEQLLFRQLAAFPGGWSPETAAAVMDSDSTPSLRLLNLMRSLSNRRLVVQDAERAGRFRMLRTVRDYALERLEADEGEAARVRGTHAAFFLAVAEDARAQFAGADQTRALETFDTERENVTAALEQFVTRGDVERALRMANALSVFWWSRDYREGWERLQHVLQLPCPDHLARLRADALVDASTLAIRLGLLDDADRMLDEALRVARREGDRGLEAQALEKIALVATDRGALGAAREQLETALAIGEDLLDRRALASILDSLAGVVIAQGEYAFATPLLERSAALYCTERDAQGGAWVRVDQALLALAQGELDAATRHARAAMSTGDEKQDWQLIAWADIYLGFACARKDHDDARTHLADALRRLLLLGDTRPQILAIEGFAALARSFRWLAAFLPAKLGVLRFSAGGCLATRA